ncbi:amidase domain-containing protein [Priestia megaterium]|nr:amidase domain-containing protein [Priestia megaterium]
MLTKKNVLYALMKAKADSYVNNCISDDFRPFIEQEYELKRSLIKKRQLDILKCSVKGTIDSINKEEEETTIVYQTHMKLLYKQKDFFFIEEGSEYRCALFYKDTLIKDTSIPVEETNPELDFIIEEADEEAPMRKDYYDRLAAVQYAEKYWNTPNPAYKQFDVNCTNYISQCLHAGKAPMRGYPNKGSGWWMQNNKWSYSWAVAHAIHNYLKNSKTGLRAKQKKAANELVIGDVICYDFEGDGRWNHTTIVVAKDGHGMPLVNANTYNSRMRYWAYEDSTAYTPNIKYAFFHIIDE